MFGHLNKYFVEDIYQGIKEERASWRNLHTFSFLQTTVIGGMFRIYCKPYDERRSPLLENTITAIMLIFISSSI